MACGSLALKRTEKQRPSGKTYVTHCFYKVVLPKIGPVPIFLAEGSVIFPLSGSWRIGRGSANVLARIWLILRLRRIELP